MKKSELPGTTLIAAVIRAESHEVGGPTQQPGAVPHLQSADKTLREVVERTLREDPNSELANRLSGMLRNNVLFEVVGKGLPDLSTVVGPWPPDRRP